MMDRLDSEGSDPSFGFLLKEWRESKGLTQEQLAQKLNVSYETVAKWEGGDVFPALSVREHIASVLNR